MSDTWGRADISTQPRAIYKTPLLPAAHACHRLRDLLNWSLHGLDKVEKVLLRITVLKTIIQPLLHRIGVR